MIFEGLLGSVVQSRLCIWFGLAVFTCYMLNTNAVILCRSLFWSQFIIKYFLLPVKKRHIHKNILSLNFLNYLRLPQLKALAIVWDIFALGMKWNHVFVLHGLPKSLQVITVVCSWNSNLWFKVTLQNVWK